LHTLLHTTILFVFSLHTEKTEPIVLCAFFLKYYDWKKDMQAAVLFE